VEPKPETPAEAPAPGRRVVKRYSNRKLYDTKDSRYVTLLQIAEMVRGGEEVQIIDNNTKEDLTEVTLAQIIYEEKKANSRSVPLQTLKDLIHTRTEKLVHDLREGPIGRLIPGSGKSEPPPGSKTDAEAKEAAPPPDKTDKTEKTEKKPDSVAPGAPPKASIVDQAKGTLEDWQQKIDERVKAVLPSVMPWQQLQHEVKRLSARIEELEAKLKSMNKE
jgi:polyhydroxyalkanoate synthesis repressor PhaR